MWRRGLFLVLAFALVFEYGCKRREEPRGEEAKTEEVELEKEVMFPPGEKGDDSLITFMDSINRLDRSKKESILIAKNEFEKMCSTAEKQIVDSAFRSFMEFYKGVIRKCNHVFYDRRDYQDLLHDIEEIVGSKFDNPLPAFEKIDSKSSAEIKTKYAATLKELYEYRNCGINFTCGEGDWYLEEDGDFLVEVLSNYGSVELRDYLIFWANEDKERFAHDGGLLISWEDLRKRIIRWEEFANKHPTLLETEKEIKPKLQVLIGAYLWGLDNTPAYDLWESKWESKKIEPELRKSYEIFLKENKTSSYYSLIKGVYTILNKHNFKLSKELIMFVDSQGYGTRRLWRFVEPSRIKASKKAENRFISQIF